MKQKEGRQDPRIVNVRTSLGKNYENNRDFTLREKSYMYARQSRRL